MGKTIEQFKVRPGEVFTLDGVEFVKLDEDFGTTLVVTRDVIGDGVPFEDKAAERDSHNKYRASNLEEVCERWAKCEHPDIYKKIVVRFLDLTTMDGMTDYGAPAVAVRALTIDEYRKYRRFIPLTSKLYWLATGYTTANSPAQDRNNVYCIDTVGSVFCENVFEHDIAPRPALYLRSDTIVSVEDGEESKPLDSFTELELLAELQRRAQK